MMIRVSISEYTWPHLCPCCLGPVDDVLRIGDRWQIPYCGTCIVHVDEAEWPYTVQLDGTRTPTRILVAQRSMKPGCSCVGRAVEFIHQDEKNLVFQFASPRYADAFAAANGGEIIDTTI